MNGVSLLGGEIEERGRTEGSTANRGEHTDSKLSELWQGNGCQLGEDKARELQWMTLCGEASRRQNKRVKDAVVIKRVQPSRPYQALRTVDY